jgi:tryptophan-rich sensory protein
MQKIKWKSLFTAIAIPLVVGAFSALLTRGSMQDFAILNQPRISVPGWLFPIVWTILYVLMGFASYLVFASSENIATKSRALIAYVVQLGFNFFWSLIFFNLSAYYFAFLWLIALIVAIVITTVRFYSTEKTAGYLLLPYLAWCIFAAYLNLAIAILN